LSFDKKTTQLTQIQDIESEEIISFNDSYLPPELTKVVQQSHLKLLPLALQNTGPVSLSDLINTGMEVTPEGILNAIQYGNLNAVQKLLLSLPSDIIRLQFINHNFIQSSMLITAANFGNLEICKLLLHCGAEINHSMVGSENSPKGDALFHAASNGHFEICQLLIAHGANVNALIKEQLKSQTILHSTVLEALLKEPSPEKKVVALLRQHGAKQSKDDLHRC